MYLGRSSLAAEAMLADQRLLPFIPFVATVLLSVGHNSADGQTKDRNTADATPAAVSTEIFPDQTSPKAACYSLLIALMQNNADVVDALYAGDEDPAFERFRTELGRVCASRQRLQKVSNERFGTNGMLLSVDLPEPTFGGAGQAKGRLSDFMAAAAVKIEGEIAEVQLALGSTIAAKRVGNKWYVHEWGHLPRDADIYEIWKVTVAAFDQLSDEIVAGKHERAVDAHERLNELIVAKAVEEFGPRADPK